MPLEYVYSTTTNSFYPVDFKQRYIDAGSWPDDGVEISEEEYLSFINAPAGKRWAPGKDGYPKLVNTPPPTPEELQQQAESEKRYLSLPCPIIVSESCVIFVAHHMSILCHYQVFTCHNSEL
ncbi:tail fiber assembly protein [Xenorhabdus siamensis]|uniref:tail fiber assembly protein n=1 Tax=Xenorhabdus siamensis TaxID=3136254 RepID=UPI0030F3EA30